MHSVLLFLWICIATLSFGYSLQSSLYFPLFFLLLCFLIQSSIWTYLTHWATLIKAHHLISLTEHSRAKWTASCLAIFDLQPHNTYLHPAGLTTNHLLNEARIRLMLTSLYPHGYSLWSFHYSLVFTQISTLYNCFKEKYYICCIIYHVCLGAYKGEFWEMKLLSD